MFNTILINSHIVTEFLIEFFIKLFTFFDKYIYLAFDFFEVAIYFNLSHTSVSLIAIAIKFLFCISLLIFARGGIPRFRFDYLTKLGWIRFLSLVILFFLVEIFLLSLI